VGLRFDPMGGGTFKNAIKQIIEVERQPIKNIENRKTREEAKLKLFQEFKGKFGGLDKTLTEFSNFKQFRELKVDLGDGSELMSVTLDKDVAEPGNYQMQIESLASRSSVLSNGFKDPTDNTMGSGFIKATLTNGETREIFVDHKSASLYGIANLINREPDNVVHASVIQDLSEPETPWRLLISSKKDGADDEVIVPEFYFVDSAQNIYIDDEAEARNAEVRINGFKIETEGNQVKDFLKGVNIQLKQAKPERPFNFTITEDYQKISGKVKGLIDQFNGILDFINKQNQVDEKSDTRTTFAGDSTLQSVEYRLRNLLHEGYPVGDPDSEEFRWVFLHQVGVEFEKTGSISFKEEKFQKMLESDFEGISEAITGPFGFAAQARKVLQGYTAAGTGTLANREAAFKSKIKKMDQDIADKELRIENKTRQLTDQFSRLQGSLNQMQQQQQYLASMGAGGGGNMLATLMGSG
jgi:flagellar hook-associated protein 2